MSYTQEYNIHHWGDVGATLIDPTSRCSSLIVAIYRMEFSGLISDARVGEPLEWSAIQNQN